MNWTFSSDITFRHERHFDDRVLSCFANRPSSPFHAFEQAVAAYPDAEAIVTPDVRLTYSELDAHAQRLAAAFVFLGIRHGDRIAMWLGNSLEFVTVLLAAWRIGAIVVPMGTRLQTPEVAYIVQHSGSKLFVHDADVASRLPTLDETPQVQHRITTGSGWPGSIVYNELVKEIDNVPVHAGSQDEIAAILYTSGTTGRPKGAMLSHLNLVHSMFNYKCAMEMGPGDRTLLAVPASHVTGLTANILLAWAAHCALIVMPEFKATAFLELAARERMTHTVIVPAMYKLCLLRPEFSQFDLSAWRVGGYGGAPMANATIAALADALPGLGLFNVYGSTETCGPVSILPPRLAAQHPDSTGYALPGTDVIVMDELERELPPGEAGELWIRGPMVVPGYWSNAEATRQGFVAGYWRSGDIGSVSRDGLLRVFDRVKDMLNRGGYKIYSAEVENILLQHPAVVESAIVGKPCPVLGERIHAFVTIKDSEPADPEMARTLRQFCADHLADYKVPETFTLGHTSLPRNANGKLLKREMREQILKQGVPS
jgi:long-chain acyl-CoA synthetase